MCFVHSAEEQTRYIKEEDALNQLEHEQKERRGSDPSYMTLFLFVLAKKCSNSVPLYKPLNVWIPHI